MMWKSAVLLLAAAAAVAQAYKTYDGYQVLRTSALSRTEVEEMRVLKRTDLRFSFWDEPRSDGQAVRIMAGPEDVDKLRSLLGRMGVGFEVAHEDVGVLVAESKRRQERRGTDGRQDDFFEMYHTYDELTAWLNAFADEDPNDNVDTVVIGQSFEGRDMTVLRIMEAGPGASNVWVEAGNHAREWISPATASYFVEQLLNTDEGRAYTEQLNFHVLLTMNPDGYDYTWTDDRLWRKTRRPQEGSICIGADPNRNFDYEWNTSGVGNTPCAEDWPGDQAFSESNTQNVRDYFLTLDPVPELSLAMHSAANLLLYPYSYAFRPEAPNAQEHQDLGDAAMDALNAANEITGAFEDGPYVCKLSAALYPSSGDSSDWYYDGGNGARFAYLIELRDEQSYGFELPPEYILPSGIETWEAFKVLLDYIIETDP